MGISFKTLRGRMPHASLVIFILHSLQAHAISLDSASADAAYDYGAVTVAVATNSAWYCPFVFDGLMRGDPTLSFSAAGDFRVTLQHSNSTQASSISIAYNHNDRIMLGVQAGSNNAGNGTRMFGFSGASAGWIAFSSEL